MQLGQICSQPLNYPSFTNLYLAKSTEGGLSLLSGVASNALKVGVKGEQPS